MSVLTDHAKRSTLSLEQGQQPDYSFVGCPTLTSEHWERDLEIHRSAVALLSRLSNVVS